MLKDKTNTSYEPEEDELMPLSYLSQYGYCPRRCGLIAVEGAWDENQFTAEGREAHTRTHTPRAEKRGSIISLFEYAVFSRKLGLSGLCDCVELHASDSGIATQYSDGNETLFSRWRINKTGVICSRMI